MTQDSDFNVRRRANATIQRTASEALQGSGLRLMSFPGTCHISIDGVRTKETLGDDWVIAVMGDGPSIVFKRVGLEGPIVKALPANVYALDDAAVTAVVSRLCDEARNEMAASLRAMAEGTDCKSVREPSIRLWGTFDDPSEEICEPHFLEGVPNVHPSRDSKKIVGAASAAISASTTAGLIYEGGTVQRQPGNGPMLRHSDPVTGNELPLLRLYALVPVGQEAAAAAKMVEYIAQKHGPGRWWTFLNLDPVHVPVDDGLFTEVIDHAPYVKMRCFYFHSAVTAVAVKGDSTETAGVIRIPFSTFIKYLPAAAAK